MLPHLSTCILLSLILVLACGDAGAEPRVRRNVEIELETVEGASLYEFQLIRKDDRAKKPMRFKSSSPHWAANVRPGMYTMQTRAYDDRGAPGDWSPPTDMKVRLPAIIVNAPGPQAKLKSPNKKASDVAFSWEPIPGANRYRIMVKGEKDSFKIEKEVSQPQWTGEVPAGHQVTWDAVAIDDAGEDGETSPEPNTFLLTGPALEKPKIDKPYSKFVQEVTWSKPDYASRYTYALSRLNPATKTWDAVEKHENITDNKVVLDINQPSGRYRMVIQAHGDFREDSPKTAIDFYMEGGFKSQADFDKAMLRDGITKPTRFYAIASYLFTKVNYAHNSKDYLAESKFEASGGTGRLGAGYQHPKSKWGGFFVADLSGFTIQGHTYTFFSSEFHLTRRMEFGQGGLLLFGSGLFYKTLPIVKGTEIDGFSGVGRATGIGPHAGFTFTQPLKSRFGVQVNGRLYYVMTGSAGGAKAAPDVTMQYGVLGSYRLDKNTSGYAGYVYRQDKAQFHTDPSKPDGFSLDAGEINTIKVDGHYLNFILEFSF